MFPSLIFPLLCVIHFVLFEPGGLRGEHICLPLSIPSLRRQHGHPGNDTGFTLRKSFSYPAEADVMIAFDNQQSKLHRPPRVVFCAILWRKKRMQDGG